MPSTSAKQAKFMRAIAHSPSFAKKVGVKQSVGKDFEMADKKKTKKFDGGGAAKKPLMESGRKPINMDRAILGSEKDIVDRVNRVPYEPMPPKMKPTPPRPLGPAGKKGYAAGGGVTKQLPTATEMGSMNMAKGGSADKAGRALVKKSADTKGRAMKFAKGGSIDGIAQRGKTKTAYPKMAKGGKMKGCK